MMLPRGPKPLVLPNEQWNRAYVRPGKPSLLVNWLSDGVKYS